MCGLHLQLTQLCTTNAGGDSELGLGLGFGLGAGIGVEWSFAHEVHCAVAPLPRSPSPLSSVAEVSTWSLTIAKVVYD